MYRTLQNVASRSMKNYRSGLDNVFRIYHAAGFKVVKIHCDKEFESLKTQLKDDYKINVNCASAQEHVPEAERNNRTLKERFRSIFHYLPFKNIPKLMIKFLAMEVARKLNMFPPRGGVSNYYSPRAILHGKPLEYSKHCRVPFGTYVQGHDDNDPKNTPQARTTDGIYLRPSDNEQGGHEFMSLSTKDVQTRKYVTTIPITQHVIRAVEAQAELDGMEGLKLETLGGQVLYDSYWIAGVDYESDYNSDNDSVLNNASSSEDSEDEEDDDDNDDQQSVQDDTSQSNNEEIEPDPEENASVQ